MKIMELIPAIDLIDGRCVRLTKGDYNEKKVYDADPLDWAKTLQDCGITRLHLVDLDGAKASSPQNLSVLERIASATDLDIEWGGGIKTSEALASVFSAGANRAICGSIAVDQPELFTQWLNDYGYEHIILGADVRMSSVKWIVSTHGWLTDSSLSLDELIEKNLPSGQGSLQLICTDISKDGMLQGPNFELYESLLSKFDNIQLTLSGGISSVDDLVKAQETGVHNTIIGKALYENKITLNDIRLWKRN